MSDWTEYVPFLLGCNLVFIALYCAIDDCIDQLDILILPKNVHHILEASKKF